MATTPVGTLDPNAVTTAPIVNPLNAGPVTATTPIQQSTVATYNPLQAPTAAQATQTQAVLDPNKGTVQGQLTNIIDANSPLMQRAAARASQQMNSRGLLNSSMAIGAGQGAVLDAATPIATSDANINNDFTKLNATEANRTSQFNTGETNTGARFNVGESNTALRDSAAATNVSSNNYTSEVNKAIVADKNLDTATKDSVRASLDSANTTFTNGMTTLEATYADPASKMTEAEYNRQKAMISNNLNMAVASAKTIASTLSDPVIAGLMDFSAPYVAQANANIAATTSAGVKAKDAAFLATAESVNDKNSTYYANYRKSSGAGRTRGTTTYRWNGTEWVSEFTSSN